MANSLNARAQSDLVESSRQELNLARDEVLKAQADRLLDAVELLARPGTT